MTKIILFLTFALCANLSFAEGTSVRGGGSGCLAEFVKSGYEVAVWLGTHGTTLQPPIAAENFLAAFDTTMIRATDKYLKYHGHAVDAYFDGTYIFVRCDRFLKNTPSTQKRIVAHEVFRSMGLEGDDYKMSRQMNFPEDSVSSAETNLQPSVVPVLNGDYMLTCARVSANSSGMKTSGVLTVLDEQVTGQLYMQLFPPTILSSKVKPIEKSLELTGMARFAPILKNQTPTFGFTNRLQMRLAVTNLSPTDSAKWNFISIVNTETYNGGVLDESTVRFGGVDYMSYCDLTKL